MVSLQVIASTVLEVVESTLWFRVLRARRKTRSDSVLVALLDCRGLHCVDDLILQTDVTLERVGPVYALKSSWLKTNFCSSSYQNTVTKFQVSNLSGVLNVAFEEFQI